MLSEEQLNEIRERCDKPIIVQLPNPARDRVCEVLSALKGDIRRLLEHCEAQHRQITGILAHPLAPKAAGVTVGDYFDQNSLTELAEDSGLTPIEPADMVNKPTLLRRAFHATDGVRMTGPKAQSPEDDGA